VTSYGDYVRVEELLSLQRGLAEDDGHLSRHEVLFVTVHQVFELWFKLVLREMVALRDTFARDPVPEPALAEAARGLDRIVRIFRSAAGHWEVVESLQTRDYLDFRDKLFPASGFQSAQMREMEVLFGLEDAERVGFAKGGQYLAALGPSGGDSAARARVEARRADRPTLREAVDDWLHRTPIRGSSPGSPGDEATVAGFVEDYLAAVRRTSDERVEALRRHAEGAAFEGLSQRHRAEIDATRAWLSPDDPRRRRIRAAILFIEGYRDLPLLAWPHQVLSHLVEVEQAFVVFRQRHARMVERVIGRRTGTGGSGVDYLDATAAYRVFKDLWSARTLLVRKDAMPPLPDARFYEFRASVS
jgi:tryptophan 2,3-dioxygenase